MDFSEYKAGLIYNKRLLKNLTPEQAPALYKFLHQRNGSMLERLLVILDKAQHTENQEGSEWGYWFFCPLSRYAVEGQAAARQGKTWRKSIILFACMGLIDRHIPTEETAATPYQQRAVEHAHEHGRRRATAFYTVPTYNRRQLEYIESKAARWVYSKGTLQEFSKSTVIDVFGQATADRVFQDERRKPLHTIEAERALHDAVVSLLDTHPYTTKGEVLAAATAAGASKAGATWQRVGRVILQRAGAKQHPPTLQQREQFSLSGNGWIITRD